MKHSKHLSLADLGNSLSIDSGTLDPKKLTVYGMFRNELYFARSFLSHYRSIGVEQFLILNDRSEDGTKEFLTSQNDCVVLSSPYSYGQVIKLTDWQTKKPVRAGVPMKTVIPSHFLANQWAIYADADEFLFLPPGISTVQDLIKRLERGRYRAVVASLVDFFPAQLSFTSHEAPENLEDLIKEASFFDPIPLITLDPDEGKIVRLNKGASSRILYKHGIYQNPWFLKPLPSFVKRLPYLKKHQLTSSAISKTPLIRWDSDVRMVGSHRANIEAQPGLILTSAHFKFTSDLERRIKMAIKLRSYSGKSRKYTRLAKLMHPTSDSGNSLLGPDSKKFNSVEDFIECELMTVPDGF
ncbi:glycosyltransferase family 2 protein [Solemya velum gill symbiont]|uniref:glycosyltransferase family 2 protein n=1 Tax=Solemya velum gill symbiont TaxID=2340 RepID=UPI00099798D1|nr:glycosyltransferase family 2 protein [Solemya velum gill symbiont]